MHTLFVDLASNRQIVAVVSNDSTVASTGIDSRSELALLPAIESVLASASMDFAQLQRIAVVVGPGGFMSLRVGISLVNALAWSLGIPLAGIHQSDLWKGRCTVEDIVWVHSTKQSQCFVRGFGSYATEWPEARLIDTQTLATALPKTTPYVGELIEAQQDALPTLQRVPDILPMERVLPSLLASLPYTTTSLVPWYGRGA